MSESKRFLALPLLLSIRNGAPPRTLGAPGALPFAVSPVAGGGWGDEPGIHVHMTYTAEGPMRHWEVRTYDALRPGPAPIGQHLGTVAVPILSPDGLIRTHATVHVFVEETTADSAPS